MTDYETITRLHAQAKRKYEDDNALRGILYGVFFGCCLWAGFIWVVLAIFGRRA